MTNDTSTLNGALQELGETMAANLTQKGVTSSASEGLTTLANKILTIPAGSCYHIEFSEDSYTAVGGSATLEISLQENYAPKVGATVTVTGSDSSLYSGLTNNDGIAQVTVTNITGTITFTCSYQSVTDTCTVIGQTYLFYDDCSSDRSNEYANASIQSSTKTNYLAMNYDSTNHRYGIKATSNEGNHYIKEITTLTGKDNIRFSAEVMTDALNANNRFGLIVGDSTAYKSMYFIITSLMQQMTMINTSESEVSRQSISGLSANTWYKMVFEVDGTSFTFKLYDMSANELYTKTGTFPSTVITSTTNKRYGLYYLNYYPSATKYFRNIKAEAL